MATAESSAAWKSPPEPAAEEPPPEESDEPTADIGDWSDDDAEARAKEQREKMAATR